MELIGDASGPTKVEIVTTENLCNIYVLLMCCVIIMLTCMQHKQLSVLLLLLKVQLVLTKAWTLSINN